MGPKKKSKLILIIIILLVILILLTGLAYAYFSTDMFKSNKELFFKYLTQMGDHTDGFIEPQLEQYFEKQKNTPYTNEGSFALNIASESGNEKEYETINNFNISFAGKTDKAKKIEEQDVSINYSNEVTFPINYRKVGDTIGLQTKYVSSKYVAVEGNQLDNTSYEGLESIEELKNSAGKLEELAQSPFSQDDWKEIQANCQKVLDEQLQESQFTKVEEGNRKGYKINIEGKQLKDIIIQLLETLKNDPKTLEKLNEYIKKQKNSASVTASTIDGYIKDIEKSLDIDKEKYEISVFQEKGKTNQLSIKLDGLELKIEKQKIEDAVQYTISIITEETNIALRANYKGLAQLQNIIENYEVELQLEPSEDVQILEKAKQNKESNRVNEEKEPEQTSNNNDIDNNNQTNKITYKYQYNNQINFDNTINIEAFSDDNAMILNNYEEEQVNDFLLRVEERIKQVNQKQMEELGLAESENPLIQIVKSLFVITQYTQPMNTLQNSNSEFQEIEVNTFNQKFENYESTNLQGVTVKGLLTTIQLNNESQEDNNRKIKEIHFDGEEYEVTDQNILLLKSYVETETAYRVEFERDEDTGIIYRAVINKK